MLPPALRESLMAALATYTSRNSTSTSAVPVPDPYDDPALRVVGALDKTVYERDLVSRHITPRTVLREHAGFHFNVSRRLSPGMCLGFVSPWSVRGEESAWRFGSKLTHLSPILYGVDSLGNLVMHEKPSWLAGLREGLSCPGCPPPAQLVPLVSLRGLDFATFFAPDEGQEERAGKLLFALLQQFVTVGLDGLVLDAHQYLARLDRPTRQLVAPKLHIFVQLLASQLSQQDRAVDGSGGAGPDSPDGPGGTLLLIVPPHPELFSPRQFEQLAEPLGGFVLSTANFSHIRGQPGPNAPLAWMRDALAALSPKDSNRHKLLATLPLLGWDFTLPDGEPSASIDGEQYLGLLRRHRPPRLDWHAEAAEHVFTYLDEGSSRHSVYYPSLKSLSERLGMLRGLGVGVALYELGTGLDFFWDLL